MIRMMAITTVAETLAAFFEKPLRSLAANGFEVHAVSSPGPVLDGLRVGNTVIRHGIALERQPHPVRDVNSIFRLIQLMRRVKPHIVHAHTPKAGLLGMAAAKAAGVPVRLYTVHGLPLMTRTGVWRRILELAERATVACSSRTYAVSPSLRNSVVDLRLCSRKKISVIGAGSCAGIDLDRFQLDDVASARWAVRQRYQIPEDAPLATYVGRLARDKGIGVLAEAWPELSKRVPELRLLIAGEFDATDPVPQSAVQALRSDSRIHFAGNVPAAEIPSIYAASDITVLPTFREGLSQVALESGAMGVPIVATRVCGLFDSVKDGVTGVLVAPYQSSPLVEAIHLLATNADLRGRLGRAAKDHVASNFDERRVNELWIDEYRRLVRESLPELAESTVQLANQ